MIAISVRQPWAWLIINGHKDIENRSSMIIKHVGKRVFVHAGQSMSLDDYQACVLFLNATFPDRKFTLPPYLALRKLCGGVVGSVIIEASGNVPHTSLWYTGDYWWKMKDPQQLPFFPCKGRLGFFNVEMPKLQTQG